MFQQDIAHILNSPNQMVNTNLGNNQTSILSRQIKLY
jgi:hypothetical protein